MSEIIIQERRAKNNIFGWVGSISAIIGAGLLSLNLVYSKYAYWILLIASVTWIVQGYRNRDNSIIVMNAVFLLINSVGIYAWII